MKKRFSVYSFLLLLTVSMIYACNSTSETAKVVSISSSDEDTIQAFWDKAWSPYIPANEKDPIKRKELEYGEDLLLHTAKYFGPKGSIAASTNGLNCTNCHLFAGTKIYGNNFGSVASTYPKYRARSGQVEDIYKRINDCFERSLNGKALANDSKEMQAIAKYIAFIGSNVKKGEKAKGSGIFKLAYLDRACDPKKGAVVYEQKCASCHGANGQGQLNPDGVEYATPPLWGPQSYNSAAGLFRISNFAGYVKYNMPFGVDIKSPQLTDEECWDVAAYVNSQERPSINISKDWPFIEEKPVDHPFGPFWDGFSEERHKYGPYKGLKSKKHKK